MDSWVEKIPWKRDRLPTPVFLGFPGGSDSKESTCNVGDLGLIPGLGQSPGGGHGNPLQCYCLENPHGWRSLAGHRPWGLKDLDMTEQLSTAQHTLSPIANTGFILDVIHSMSFGKCIMTCTTIIVLYRIVSLLQKFPMFHLFFPFSSQNYDNH